MAIASNLGFPRMGIHRELKKALENYWAGKSSVSDLTSMGRVLRMNHWTLQKRSGIRHIPSNDFSFYDHVLDTIAMVGAVPARYQWGNSLVGPDTYFAMARGVSAPAGGKSVSAMEMTKWFDTNYHYIVPEFVRDQKFSLASLKPAAEFLEAKSLGIHTRPVLLGPVSFLLLGKAKNAKFDPLLLIGRILPVYEEILHRLAEAGATWIQIDEPMLALDARNETRQVFFSTYEKLSQISSELQILVATYFAGLGTNMEWALKLPVAAFHLDLVRSPEQLDQALKVLPAGLLLSLGVVDGRNIWKTDLERAFRLVDSAANALGHDRLLIAPSCSLLHCPVDLEEERAMDRELRSWLAFSRQKLEEVVAVECALSQGRNAVKDFLDANARALQAKRHSSRVHDSAVKQRIVSISKAMSVRTSPYATRKKIQQERLHLPEFPTTTIGSFPQTKEVREARASHKSGKITAESYESFLRSQTADAVRFQEEIGLDVLVHGEFERNDMVEYFGEQLSGFAATENGWVQSYGSRCVKPPFIFGDVFRKRPMTVAWAQYAQSLTKLPMKGMLTGPVTILQWSFVRDDQPRSETCRQIALAIRDEVVDLEAAGIAAIQIDEPAIREGLPLIRADWPAYLAWAVESFRISSSGVRDATQIHTHMCYSEFQDIIDAVAAMDADVISIETSRSQMELLQTFAEFHYPNDIGPGVYDIHSPRIPTRAEMIELLRKAARVLSPSQIWVNPDCGLKTRRWEEVRPALVEMVEAARSVRREFA